jgi:hypothetical protein
MASITINHITPDELQAALDGQSRAFAAEVARLSSRIAALEGSQLAPGPSGPDPAPGPAPQPGPAGRIIRVGTQLMRDGQPWLPVGVNAQTLLHSDTDDQVNRLFRTLPTGSLIRTFGFGNPRAPMSLDRAQRVAEMAEAAGHVLLICLSNGVHGRDDDAWRDGNKDRAWYSSGWRTQLLPHIDRWVRALASSPAVMWQSMNEIGQSITGELDEVVVREFNHATASEIKSRAPDQLVWGGVQDSYQSFMRADGSFGRVHDSPAIDGADMHEYESFSVNNPGVANRFGRHREQMAALGKPVMVGEYGVGRKGVTMTPDERAAAAVVKVRAYRQVGAAASLYWGVAEPWVTSDNSTNSEAAWERPDGAVVRAIAGA